MPTNRTRKTFSSRLLIRVACRAALMTVSASLAGSESRVNYVMKDLDAGFLFGISGMKTEGAG